MNLFKMKYVVPIGKSSFRIHVLVSFIFQLSFVIIASLALHFSSIQLPEISTFSFFIVLSALNCVLLVFIYDVDKYRARFKDIYPDHNLSLLFYLLTGFFPPVFLAFTFFLCNKSSSDLALPRFFSFRFALLALVPLIALQALSPRISLWSATPSIYFIVDVMHDTLDLVEFKKKVGYRNDLIEEYQQKYPGKLSSTQLVLLVAVDAAVVIKEKDRAIASGTERQEARYKYGLEVLDSCHKSILISEKTKMNFLDFSPLHWLHPSGPLEILALSMVDQQILTKFNTTLLGKSTDLLNKMEKGLAKMSSPRKEYYSKRILELRQKFSKTKTFISKT